MLLAVLAGAIRRFMLERLVNPATIDFRVSAPVTLDTETSHETVAEWIVEMPIWEMPSAVPRACWNQLATSAVLVIGPSRAAPRATIPPNAR